MVTFASNISTLQALRAKVSGSGMLHMPRDYCFLYKGHPLDPSVEGTLHAAAVGLETESQVILFIDSVHCNLRPASDAAGVALPRLLTYSLLPPALLVALCFCAALLPCARRGCKDSRGRRHPASEAARHCHFWRVRRKPCMFPRSGLTVTAARDNVASTEPDETDGDEEESGLIRRRADPS